MSKLYESEFTLDIGGDERDVRVRCLVDVIGLNAELDGSPEALVDGGWVDTDNLDIALCDLERIEERLCEQALEDDADQCVDWGECA